MKLSHLLFATLFTALSASGPTFAVEDSAHQRAKELIEVTQTAKMMDQIYPQVESMISQPLADLKADPKYQEIVTRYERRMIDTFMQELKWEGMEGDVIELYTKVFSEQELGELIAFYRSPLGQKLLERMPLLMQETMSLTQRRITATIPKVQAIGSELQAELKTLEEKETPAAAK